jgi:hypothetical protein
MSEDVILEFTPTYARALDASERMRKLYYPPRLRWPEFVRIPYLFAGVVIAVAVGAAIGEVVRPAAGSSAQFWASLLTSIVVIVVISWVWALVVRRGAKMYTVKWLEKTYGPPKSVRVTADANSIVWEADTYVMSAKWSGVQGIDILEDAIFVRSSGLNILLGREIFSGPAHMGEVASALTACWIRSREGPAPSPAAL